MMDRTIFEFNNYTEYLQARLGGKKSRSGSKTTLATHLDMKASFLSRILGDQSDFSFEQAFETCSFLKLNDLEKQYFMELVALSRAGNSSLKNFHITKLKTLKKQSENIEKRIKEPNKLSHEDHVKYYSKWIYLAVHIAVSIPNHNTADKIRSKFQLDKEKANEVLNFLTKTGIIKYNEKAKQYISGGAYTHINQSSDLIQQHHFNWRMKSLDQISKDHLKDLHYSGVFSLSREDALKLKNNFLELINKHIETIKPSKEEVMYCQIIDFFEI